MIKIKSIFIVISDILILIRKLKINTLRTRLFLFCSSIVALPIFHEPVWLGFTLAKMHI